jgi:anti-sigma B factor antagonist
MGRSVPTGESQALASWLNTAWLPYCGQREEGDFVDLSLETRHTDDVTIVAVGGEIDVYTAPKLRDKVTELVGEGHYNLVIDMENVEFLDSTGLGVLVGGLKKVRAHDGSMEIVCNQDRLLKIFRITGLAKVFTIHDSEAAALSAH